jgi:hypothetical protein
MRYQECFCGGEIDTADYDERYIAQCENCKMKFEVYPDAEFDDGRWCDLTTIRPLLALPDGERKLPLRAPWPQGTRMPEEDPYS